MSRQTRLNGDRRGLGVADFSDQENVGILAEHRAERGRKVKPWASLTWSWEMPGMSYSTGSSTVMMLTLPVLSSFTTA